jgi:hypothetical protein
VQHCRVALYPISTMVCRHAVDRGLYSVYCSSLNMRGSWRKPLLSSTPIPCAYMLIILLHHGLHIFAYSLFLVPMFCFSVTPSPKQGIISLLTNAIMASSASYYAPNDKNLVLFHFLLWTLLWALFIISCKCNFPQEVCTG